MSKKSVILIVLLILLCAALIFRHAAASAEDAETETGTSQIMPRESESTETPAQPGEGPAGLPTPTV